MSPLHVDRVQLDGRQVVGPDLDDLLFEQQG